MGDQLKEAIDNLKEFVEKYPDCNIRVSSNWEKSADTVEVTKITITLSK